MKFVDEATIEVMAGRGGHGCLSFRREKFIPKGGPDGGNGGVGGDIYLQASGHLNTLVDFRYRRHFKAAHGRGGAGKLRTGACGEPLIIPVPVGTRVFDHSTEECLGELLHPRDRLLVAKGGAHGLGNAHFKSSVNRAPRRFTQGAAGDARQLRLELSVLADVGLLGVPNVGKSTLIRAVSAAKPKVADYPFTTTYPHLGVVAGVAGDSFVMADIPGLIAGAAQGVGLGDQFLKHLERTRILLHLVDASQPLEQVAQDHHDVITALGEFKSALLQKPRWLVINKMDTCPLDQRDELVASIQAVTSSTQPAWVISAQHRQGLSPLCQALLQTLSDASVPD